MNITSDTLSFSSGEACALSGLAYKRMDAWARSGFIAPSLKGPHGDKARRRYSFKDIVSLTVARKLGDMGFSLPALRKMHTVLRKHRASFADAWMIVGNGDVFQVTKDPDAVVSIVKNPGQARMPVTILDLGHTVKELQEMAAAIHQTTVDDIINRATRGESQPKASRKQQTVQV
jgi:DNA-binding transcriptional MerR regulator